MAFHFIHTGDWHLAKPFGRFDAEKAPRLRAARTQIVERVGDLARRLQAQAVLVAGDVFDGPMAGDQVLRRLAAQLEDYRDVAWHFLPGNHDPAIANGVWQRFAAMVPSRHVVIHQEAGVVQLTDEVDLLAAPLKTRAIAHDPTAWMGEQPSADGVIRIGLAHGAVQAFGSGGGRGGGNGGLIAPDRAVKAELDYLALGDWHGVREAGPRAFYAGTPEPDQFPDNEPGYVLGVRIEGAGAQPEVVRHWLGVYRWQRHVLEGDVVAGLDRIEREIVAAGAAAQRWLVRIDVGGRVSLDDELALRERIERLGDRTFHTEADFSKMTVDTGELDADAFGDPLLAAVGGRLADAVQSGGDGEAVAHRALLLLAGLSRDGEAA